MVFEKKKILELQFFFIINYWSGEWLLISKKSYISSGPRCESIKICILEVCKNIVEKFMAITSLLEELMILLRGQSVIL